MTSISFVVDPTRCIQCDACVDDCPSHIIERSRERSGSTPSLAMASEGLCLQCQHCLAVCPTGAISIFGLKPENSLTLANDTFPSREQMRTFVRGRRSVRQFRRENVPARLIDELLADLAHAPTGCNARDLTFSIVDDRQGVERLLGRLISAIENEKDAAVPDFVRAAAASYRQDQSDHFFRGAPHLLVVSPGTTALCGHEDVVIALTCFEMLAQSAGLGTTWCGILKLAADAVSGIRPILGLAPDTYFYTMMFGFPAVKYTRTVQRDTAARIHHI